MSDLEIELARLLKAAGIDFQQQFLAVPGRKLAYDFLLTGTKILIECKGGTWKPRTGHTSGSGIARDYEKLNLGQLSGYVVLIFTAADIHSDKAINTIKQAISIFGVRC